MEHDKNITEALLLSFFRGETSEIESATIQEWIELSDENSQMAKDIYSIYCISSYEQTEDIIDVNVAFNSVKGRIAKKNNRVRRAQLFQLVQKIAVAIVIPLSLFTAYLLTKNPINTVQYLEVTSKRGMVTKTVLPDSTIVWLNSGSTLRYPSFFQSSERNVELNGEAYFDVARNEEQRFIINTGKDLSISVLGTEFNVEAYADDNSITTTLVEGSVRLDYKDEAGLRKQSLLTPSQKLVYETESGRAQQESVSVSQYIAWKDGKIVFEDTNLKDALHILGKHFNVDFVVKNKQLYANAFTGKFEGERLDEIMSLIEMSSNLRYSYQSNDLFKEKRVIEIY